MLFIGCIQSCSTEESLLENNATIKTVTKEEAILFLKKHETTVSISSKNATLAFDFNKITQENLTNTSELLTVVPVINKAKNQRTRALLLKVENSIETILYREYADVSSTKNNFTGVILMTKLNGDFIRAYRLKNNEYDIELAPAKGNKAAKNIIASSNETVDGGELQEVVIAPKKKRNTSKQVYLTLMPSGSSNTTEEGNYVFIWESMGGGDGSAETETEEEDEQIDTTELKGKEKCLNDLLTKQDNPFVKKLLANFQGDGSKFDIKIISKDKVTNKDEDGKLVEVNGKTIFTNGSNIITIEINTNRINSHSSLDAVRTILHEYVHADIFRKLNSITNEVVNDSTDFKQIFEKYGNHHSTIAALYIQSMKEVLKEFHKTKLPNCYNGYKNYFDEEPSDDFYEAIAWNGLKEKNVKAWANLTQEEKTKIETLAKRDNLLIKASPCLN
ncbi:hypothetical protein [Flavobacterium sp.]|uniref:hypothetical protein n=1 Tax=Flavobacterium sp. TaxID=239 RepID=UPI0022BC4FD8|nr:hypothetical protein [Flavobacterium sp.]MCZ8228995.1 hypothetical protein [Flavobacterium sp.]